MAMLQHNRNHHQWQQRQHDSGAHHGNGGGQGRPPMNGGGRNKRIFYETFEQYATITRPYIQRALAGDNEGTKWIYEILEGKREADRIVFDDPHPTKGFVLVPTFKWERRGFPIDQFYFHAFVNANGILTIRELTKRHLPLLLNLRNKIGHFLHQNYAIGHDQICMFFHYLPTAFHLHLHICSKKMVNDSVPRNVYLAQVISNLNKKGAGSFYQQATLPIYLDKRQLFVTLFAEFARAEAIGHDNRQAGTSGNGKENGCPVS